MDNIFDAEFARNLVTTLIYTVLGIALFAFSFWLMGRTCRGTSCWSNRVFHA